MNLRIIFAAIFTSGFIASCSSKPVAPQISSGVAIAKVGDLIISSNDLLAEVELIQKKTPQVLSTHPQKIDLLQQMIFIEMMNMKWNHKFKEENFSQRSQFADEKISELIEASSKQLTDSRLQSFYEENKDRVDQVSARHILKRVGRRATPDEKKRIYSEMKSIREKLLKNPEEFPEVARRESEDPGSAPKGGDLGFFTYGQMLPEFSKAAFALEQINEISPIITTQYGYHIIQLTGAEKGLEAHRQILTEKLRTTTFQNELSDLRQNLQEEYSPVVYEENLLTLSPLPDIVFQDADKVLPEKLGLEEPKKKKP